MSVNPTTGQKSLLALKHFSPGDVICAFDAGTTLPHANRYTVQIDLNKHITLMPEFLQYVNHSCSPNAFFDTTQMLFICLKEINPGEEFTFFYPSTEWEMAEPFNCHCGSTVCLQTIKGASSIPDETLLKYKLTDFIRQMMIRKLNT